MILVKEVIIKEPLGNVLKIVNMIYVFTVTGFNPYKLKIMQLRSNKYNNAYIYGLCELLLIRYLIYLINS